MATLDKTIARIDAKLIYLASPYSSYKDTEQDRRAEHQARYEIALHAAALLANEGIICFSPIVNSHPLAIAHEMPTDWDYWKRFDAKFIERSDALWILDIDGWHVSKGVTAEIRLARYYHKPIAFLSYPSLELKQCSR